MGNSPFFGIEIGLRALQAQQRALDVVGHNIANANTPGYSRQRLELTASEPYTVPSAMRPGGVPGQVGTGVTEEAVRRFRDTFLDRQYRNENTSYGTWATREQVLGQVEAIFMEPTDNGLRATIDKFWQAVQDLANDPDGSSARSLVRQRAVEFTSTLSHMYKQIADLRDNTTSDMGAKIKEINTAVEQIASLNRQISQAMAVGDSPNDLMDKRDLLVDNLTKLVDAREVLQPNGILNVYIGGVPAVEGFDAHHLKLETEQVTAPVIWDHLNRPAAVNGGDLGALIGLRDNDLTNYMDQLDWIAYQFGTAFNAQHRQGFDLNSNPGGDFFDGLPVGTPPDPFAEHVGAASRITVSAGIMSDLNLIASASIAPVKVEDRGNAEKLSDLFRDAKLFPPPDPAATPPYVYTAPLSDYYISVTSRLGVDSQAAQRLADNQELLLKSIDNQRTGVSGVSLDEEMVNMIKYQNAYSAAARIVTTVDEMLDTIINRLGVVGR